MFRKFRRFRPVEELEAKELILKHRWVHQAGCVPTCISCGSMAERTLMGKVEYPEEEHAPDCLVIRILRELQRAG